MQLYFIFPLFSDNFLGRGRSLVLRLKEICDLGLNFITVKRCEFEVIYTVNNIF